MINAVVSLTKIEFKSLNNKTTYFENVLHEGKNIIESLTSKRKPIVSSLHNVPSSAFSGIDGGTWLANRYVSLDLLLFLKQHGLKVSDECIEYVRTCGATSVGSLYRDFNLDLYIGITRKFAAATLKKVNTNKKDTFRGKKIFYVPEYNFKDRILMPSTVYKDTYYFQPDKVFLTHDNKCINLFENEIEAKRYLIRHIKPNMYIKLNRFDPNVLYSINIISTLIPRENVGLFGKRLIFANWNSINKDMLKTNAGIKLQSIEKYVIDKIIEGDL